MTQSDATIISQTPHTRLNPLTGERILVSPHRLQRPWQGKVEDITPDERPAYDPQCYLCPGNERAGGARNPKYEATFCFTNDFAALLPEQDRGQALNFVNFPRTASDEMQIREIENSQNSMPDPNDLFTAQAERGLCRVVCFSPRHDLTLPRLELAALRGVVDTWITEFEELAARDYIGYVQIFENKGALMGCSNPHPHGQIWATETVPVEPAKEDARQREYFARHARTLLADYLDEELRRAERLVCANDHWAALVPFWAKWPFETILIPRRPIAQLPALSGPERAALAAILRALTTRYDNLFRCSFPYSMGFHQAPTDGAAHPHWHLHAHFYPPLLRSATVQKFMVGFEMLGTPQRDLTPERAAEMLRAQSETHYLDCR